MEWWLTNHIIDKYVLFFNFTRQLEVLCTKCLCWPTTQCCFDCARGIQQPLPTNLIVKDEIWFISIEQKYRRR